MHNYLLTKEKAFCWQDSESISWTIFHCRIWYRFTVCVLGQKKKQAHLTKTKTRIIQTHKNLVVKFKIDFSKLSMLCGSGETSNMQQYNLPLLHNGAKDTLKMHRYVVDCVLFLLTFGFRPRLPFTFFTVLTGFLLFDCSAGLSATVAWVSTFTRLPLFLDRSSGWIRGRTPPFEIVTPRRSWQKREAKGKLGAFCRPVAHRCWT